MDGLKESLRSAKGEVLLELIDVERKAEAFSKWRRPPLKKDGVYWAAVRFLNDDRFYKVRPVILLEDLPGRDTVKILSCTGVDRDGRYPLTDYMNMGFKKPTYVDIANVIEIPRRYVFLEAAKPLSKEDILGLTKAIRERTASQEKYEGGEA